jgi:hypothetical protein
VTIVHSPLAAGAVSEYVDRVSNANTSTTNVANSFVGVDLGPGRALAPNYYSMRARTFGSADLPRTWKLQGTNGVAVNTEAGFNSAIWTDLDTQSNNTTISTAGGWVSVPVSGAGAYRYLRIIQTGANSSGSHFFTVAEVEFYGALSY